MKLLDREFCEIMDQFEKDIKIYGHKIEREDTETIKRCKVYYKDGFVNDMFKAYILGYSNHKNESVELTYCQEDADCWAGFVCHNGFCGEILEE